MDSAKLIKAELEKSLNPSMSETKPRYDLLGEHKKWIETTFLYYAWGKEDADLEFSLILEKAETLLEVLPDLIFELERSKKRGRNASNLYKSITNKLNKGASEEELQAWVANLADKVSYREHNFLEYHLNKELEGRRKQTQNRKSNQSFKISLPYVEFEGVHPQSLRALKPSNLWDIVIDETGLLFNEEARELSATSTKLGRVVALVMPQNHKLPELRSHAVDVPVSKIEKIFSKIISSPCGILGATVQQDLRTYNWMSAISQLTRWALMLLPLDKKAQTRVRVYIENRQPFTTETSLRAWQDNLISELKLLAPERFANLNLTLEIADKGHPYNGYPDAIANAWASPTSDKRKLLARTRWRDTCLLQNSNLERVERLYQSLSSTKSITPKEWFELCKNASQEGKYSLLKDILQDLAQEAKNNPKLWQNYLAEALGRIATKNFDAHSLNQALVWLDEAKPAGEVLSKDLELRLGAAELAAQNHLGITNIQKIEQLLKLSQELKDEDAPTVCEIALRIAVSATNSYDFDIALPYIQKWLGEPLAVPGLKNYAKVHSTLGQLYAFKADYPKALEHFNQALELFDRLSNPIQKAKEIQQTQTYLLIALLASQDLRASEKIQEFIEKLLGQELDKTLGYLARSGAEFRYQHYLMIRWIASYPEKADLRQAYLKQQDSWQTGEHHPWMLINAYRAWLLVQEGRRTEAEGFMQTAIEACLANENSAVLTLMGHSLIALGKSFALELDLDLNPSPAKFDLLEAKQANLAKLAQATTDAARWQELEALLPFNFH